MASTVRRRNAAIPNNVTITGAGPETVVLAHGFGVDQISWRHIVPTLSARHRVVTFDLVGFTASSKTHYDNFRYSSLDAYAEDLLAILTNLGIEECLYVGHSVSGMVGLLASLMEPNLFKRIVLLGASPCYVSQDGYRGGFTQDDLTGLFEAMVSNYSVWSERFAPTATARPAEHPAVEEFARGLLAMRPDIALSIATTIFRSDYREQLSRVRVPCSILQTRADAAVPMEVARHLHAHLAGSVLEIIDTEGHVPQLTAPEAVADALQRHLWPAYA